jgi:hypothetical protein
MPLSPSTKVRVSEAVGELMSSGTDIPRRPSPRVEAREEWIVAENICRSGVKKGGIPPPSGWI